MSLSPPTSGIIVVDGQRLRRAQVEAFLQPWCLREGLSLDCIDPDEIGTIGSPAMIVVSIGQASSESDEMLRMVADIREVAPERPVVVLSDLEEVASMVAAFEAGVKGYIPTTTDPEIALDALSFILGGGHYFPSPALDSEPWVNNGTRR